MIPTSKNLIKIMSLQKQFLTLSVYILMIIHIILKIIITCEGDVLAIRGLSAAVTSKNQDDDNNETALLLAFKSLFINNVSGERLG